MIKPLTSPPVAGRRQADRRIGKRTNHEGRQVWPGALFGLSDGELLYNSRNNTVSNQSGAEDNPSEGALWQSNSAAAIKGPCRRHSA